MIYVNGYRVEKITAYEPERENEPIGDWDKVRVKTERGGEIDAYVRWLTATGGYPEIAEAISEVA